jgi:hypothetical protein
MAIDPQRHVQPVSAAVGARWRDEQSTVHRSRSDIRPTPSAWSGSTAVLASDGGQWRDAPERGVGLISCGETLRAGA